MVLFVFQVDAIGYFSLLYGAFNLITFIIYKDILQNMMLILICRKQVLAAKTRQCIPALRKGPRPVRSNSLAEAHN